MMPHAHTEHWSTHALSMTTDCCFIAPLFVAVCLPRYSYWQSFTECSESHNVIVGKRYSYIVPTTEVISADRSNSTTLRYQAWTLYLFNGYKDSDHSWAYLFDGYSNGGCCWLLTWWQCFHLSMPSAWSAFLNTCTMEKKIALFPGLPHFSFLSLHWQ